MKVAGRDIEVNGDYQISGTAFLLFFLFPSVIFSVCVLSEFSHGNQRNSWTLIEQKTA